MMSLGLNQALCLKKKPPPVLVATVFIEDS